VFGWLIRQDQLYRLAWSIVRDDDDALDAAQETCIAAWRELPSLRDPERFDAWLSRSMVNRCRDVLGAGISHMPDLAAWRRTLPHRLPDRLMTPGRSAA
jgi:DNA-directed RNA polymerase specialized sigma24 family protein